MSLCEIRVPTYKRPDWLRRALASAVAQDYGDLRILVLDDAPGPATEAVIAEFADPRILYRPNPKNLGASANIDLAFRSEPMAGGDYFCILEDDNRILPNYVSSNIGCLKRSGLHIVQRDQEVWAQTADSASPTGRTTRGRYFAEGAVDPLTVRAAMFFCEGLSNGGLFWDAGKRSDLSVGPAVTDAGISENCRSLQIVEPIYFAAEPLAIFTDMVDVAAHRARATTADRSFGRARQAIVMRLLALHGRAIRNEARRIAVRTGVEEAYELALIDALRPSRRAFRIGTLAVLRRLAKSTAKWLTVENALGNYSIADLPRVPPATWP